MSAVIGALRIDLSASVAQFASDMASAGTVLEGFGKKFKAVAHDLTTLGTTLSLALTLPIVALGVSASKVATEAAQATGQVEAAIKSMGNTSGRSSAQLEATSKALAHVSTYTSVDILRNVTAGMLQFGNVQGPIFDRAQKSVIDLATRMGGDLAGATTLVGRALEDPIGGLTRLARAGIVLTEQQKDQIKALVKNGEGMKAQVAILDLLDQKFGGSAAAMRAATPGADVKESWHEFEETLGKIVNQFLPPLTAMLSKLIDKFQELPPGVQKAAVEFAAAAAVIGPIILLFGGIAEGAVKIASSLGGLLKLFEGFGAAAGTEGAAGGLAVLADAFGPVGIAVGAAVAFVVAFKDTFIKALSDVWTYAQAVLGPAWQQLATSFGNAWTALTTGPVGESLHFILQGLADLIAWLLKAFGTGMVNILAGFFKFVADGFNAFADVLNFIGDLLTGKFSKAWTDMGNFVLDTIAGIIRGIATLIPALDGVATKLEEIQNRAHAAQQPQKPVAPGPAFAPQLARPALTPLKPQVFNQGKTSAPKSHVADATETLKTGLADLGQSITEETLAVPAAISKTDAFTKSLDHLIEAAKKAHVNTAAFGAVVADLRAKIAEFRTTELQREAEKFAKSVDADAKAVDDFGKGGLDPLTQKLRDVDDRYNNLKDTITEEIKANEILAKSNADAAAAMAKLQAQLAALETAHTAAATAARAQYAAEQAIADLRQQETNLSTAKSIRDFRANATGVGAAVGSADQATQKAQDQLDQQRLALEIEIKTLQTQRDKDVADGYLDEAKRLDSNIALQTQFLNLVNSTTAQQLAGQEKLNQAWDSFSNNLSTAIEDIGAKGKNVGQDLGKAVQGLLHDAIIKPFADQAAGSLTKMIRGALGLGDNSKPDGSANNPFHVIPLGGSATAGPAGGLAGVLQNPIGAVSDAFQRMTGLSQIGGSVGSGISSAVNGIGSFFSSFLGGLAGGGRMTSGSWAVVGEEGPELWAPNRTGYIVPQEQAFGGGSRSMTVIQNIQTPDVASFGHSDRQLARQANRSLRQIG